MCCPPKRTGLESHPLQVRFLSCPLAGFPVIPTENIVTNNMGAVASEWQYQDENLVFMNSQSSAASSSHPGDLNRLKPWLP